MKEIGAQASQIFHSYLLSASCTILSVGSVKSVVSVRNKGYVGIFSRRSRRSRRFFIQVLVCSASCTIDLRNLRNQRGKEKLSGNYSHADFTDLADFYSDTIIAGIFLQ